MMISIIFQLSGISKELLSTKEYTVVGILLAVILGMARFIFFLLKRYDKANEYNREQDKENLKMIGSMKAALDKNNDILSDLNTTTNDIKTNVALIKSDVKTFKKSS